MIEVNSMRTHLNHRIRRKSEQGISLLIVLVMLVIIGITASTAMRTATSEQRATNNIRSQVIAQQYAEAALRICEGQMKLTSASRKTEFQSPLPASSAATARWNTAANWTGSTVSGRYQFTSADNVYDANNNPPTTYPQCLVELQEIPASPTPIKMTVITARGFSPDYAKDSTSGETTQGAVVWLQSIVNAQ